MSTTTKEVIELMEILPENDQNLALELIKKLVLAWDPDYTKITTSEQQRLDEAINEIKQGKVVGENAINWD